MRLRLGLLPLLIVAAVVVPAQAAPDQSGKLTADAPQFKWDGATGVSVNVFTPLGSIFGCGDPGYTCEDTLLDVQTVGDLNVKITSTTPGAVDPSGNFSYPDFDAYLLKSNAAGEVADGAEPVASSTAVAADEELKATGLPAGFYVVRVAYFTALEDGYSGDATLSNFAAPAPPEPAPAPAPATPSEPAAAPAPPPAQPEPQPQPASAPAPMPTPAPATQSKPRSKQAAVKRCKAKARKKKNAKKRKAAMKRCAKRGR